MSGMTWEQKLQAIQALGETSLHMRKPGDWYVRCRGVEIGHNGLLRGGGGNGATPEQAVIDWWRTRVDELPDSYVLVVDAMAGSRRHVRWNGFMWQDEPFDRAAYGEPR